MYYVGALAGALSCAELLSMMFRNTFSLSIAGVYSLPVSSLQNPPQHLQVREVKEWYVDYLMGMLLEEKDEIAHSE